MAEVMVAGGIAVGGLQPWLTASASADLALLDDALAIVSLQPRLDEHWLQGHRSTKVRAGDLYGVLRTPLTALQLSEMNWDCFASKKVKVLFWILQHNRTCTRVSLHRHSVLDTPDCPFCPGTLEDEDHMFATCPRLGQLWARMLPGQAPSTTTRYTAEALGALFLALPRTAAHTTSIAVLWVIWKARKAMVFNTDHQGAVIIARQLQAHLHLWFCRAPSKLDVEPLKLCRAPSKLDVEPLKPWCQT
jgi:hypothetical protein